MNAKTITYSRLKNLGDYNNEKVEITLEVTDGEKADDVLNAAKDWVSSKLGDGVVTDTDVKLAHARIANPDEYTGAQIKKAQEVLDKHAAIQSRVFPF